MSGMHSLYAFIFSVEAMTVRNKVLGLYSFITTLTLRLIF